MPLTIYFDARQLTKYLGNAVDRWPEAASRALEKVGRLVWDQSQREVPKGKTNTLGRSGTIMVKPHTVLITYATPYARAVHFRKRVKHPTGKRMFLTGPLGKGKRLLGAEIADEVAKAMESTPTS